MANIKALTILSMLYLVAGDKMAPNSTTPTPPSPITFNVTTVAPTTVPPIPPNTTTTTKPTTTTTLAPNTTTATTTTTTPAPNTTTATPTTTTTPPPLTPGKWVANYTGTNRTCLVFEAALHLDLVLEANKTYSVNVPATAVAEGICDSDKTENITIKFRQANSVTFDFVKSNDSKKYEVEAVVVTIAALNGTGAIVLVNQSKEFSTPVSNSYKCSPERALMLVPLDKAMNYTGTLHISHLQLQAFRNSTSQKFDEALDCEGSETPDVVPIAVGLALVTLVIIVLIAYLIGRRRSQARGYLSM